MEPLLVRRGDARRHLVFSIYFMVMNGRHLAACGDISWINEIKEADTKCKMEWEVSKKEKELVSKSKTRTRDEEKRG